jgi:hypothetical protein
MDTDRSGGSQLYSQQISIASFETDKIAATA